MTTPEPAAEYDVVIVGGGPAGSTSASVLAQRGHSVLLLERVSFPRFHIGESLLTYTAPLLERLGVADRLRQSRFPVKTGAEFCDITGKTTRVDFADQGGDRAITTFQVERAIFDNVLLERAAEVGATIVQRARVTGPVLADGRIAGVTYRLGDEDRERTVRARWVLDASGRAGVLSHQHFGGRRLADRLRNIAVFRHYTGVDEATNPGVEGDIQIGSHADGWVWAIPIGPGKLSVGAVTQPEILRRAGSLAEFHRERVSRIPRIHQRIADVTTMSEARTERDFSYYNETVAGPGFLAVGDAGCFVDPIFSAGVHLATSTGLRAGESVSDLLHGKGSEEEVLDRYARFYKTGYDSYLRLIYAFYDHGFKIGRFLKSTGAWVAPVWVARLLGGDFWSRKNALANHLRTIDEYATFQPFEPLFGCPVYPDTDAAEPDGATLADTPVGGGK